MDQPPPKKASRKAASAAQKSTLGVAARIQKSRPAGGLWADCSLAHCSTSGSGVVRAFTAACEGRGCCYMREGSLPLLPRRAP